MVSVEICFWSSKWSIIMSLGYVKIAGFTIVNAQGYCIWWISNECMFTFPPCLNLHWTLSLDTKVPVWSHDRSSESELKMRKKWARLLWEPPRASTFVWDPVTLNQDDLYFKARSLPMHPWLSLPDWTWKYLWIWHFPDITQGRSYPGQGPLSLCPIPILSSFPLSEINIYGLPINGGIQSPKYQHT
jgi:hypothetical protein